MNPPKFNEDDYISFLVASPKIFTCTEAERVLSGQENASSHDSVSRLLHRLKASASDLGNGALPFAGLKNGVLIPDDSTLDKRYSQHIEPVCRHRSGKNHPVVKGISLLRCCGLTETPIFPVIAAFTPKLRTEKPKMTIFLICFIKQESGALNHTAFFLTVGMQDWTISELSGHTEGTG